MQPAHEHSPDAEVHPQPAVCAAQTGHCTAPAQLQFDQVLALQQEAQRLMDDLEFEVDSAHVLALVRDSDRSACGCEFIALARQLGTRLVTMDRKLLRAFPADAVALAAAV